MKNKEIAEIFENMADILEFNGDNTFRINSYRKAARVIRDLGSDIQSLVDGGNLKNFSGLGAGMADKVNQYLSKGKIDKYEEIKKGIPKGLIPMLKIPGLGPKTAYLLYKELNIGSIKELADAIKKGKLRDLPGMGARKEENILRGIRLLEESGNRILLGDAIPLVERIMSVLKNKNVSLISPAGSLRRMKETVGDIDILVGAGSGAKIINDFVSGPGIDEVLACGETKGSVIVAEGIQVDIRVVDEKSFGAALQYFTGSKDHNVHLREIARKKGLKINEYGVFRGKKKIGGGKEDDIYKALGCLWIPPVLREDRGEIEAALQGKLPQLVAEKDIRADLHVHSKWSDGSAGIFDIARAAQKMGYSYIVITDHSQSLKIAGGLSIAELEDKIKEVKDVNRKLNNFTVLCGAEVDIKNDGSMDYPDRILSKLDVVLGAIHSGFKQDKNKITGRIISAVNNPHVDIIAHPTGRIIGVREPYEVDMEVILEEARKTGTALEINAYYQRLDLDDVWARKAKQKGVKMAIGTDSHHLNQLWMMRLGVGVAGRAWLEKKDILNTLSVAGLIKYLTK